jgi:hypothetical protein
MNMTVSKNAEIRQGGNVIRVNVEVDGFVAITGPSAGKYQWSGVLRPPNNIGLIRGETYTLILPDYSPARIEVTDEANPVDGSVPFRVIGDLPERKAS